MLLNEIKFELLDKYFVNLKWGQNVFHQERQFYSDDKYIYKIWHRKYIAHQLEVVANEFRTYKFRNKDSHIASMDCGLVNRKTCPAYVDVITDSKNICRGYILKKGDSILNNKEISSEFIELVWQATLKSGYAHTDFCISNIIKINNTLSLIDIDTNPTRLKHLNIDFERSKGSLRNHVLPTYKNLLEAHFYFLTGI